MKMTPVFVWSIKESIPFAQWSFKSIGNCRTPVPQPQSAQRVLLTLPSFASPMLRIVFGQAVRRPDAHKNMAGR